MSLLVSTPASAPVLASTSEAPQEVKPDSRSFESELRRGLSAKAIGLGEKVAFLRSAWDGLPTPKPAENAAQLLNSLSLSFKNSGSEPIPPSLEPLASEIVVALHGNVRTLSLKQLGEIALSCGQLRCGDEKLVRDLASAAARKTPLEYEDVTGLARVAQLLAVWKLSAKSFLDSLSTHLDKEEIKFVPRGFASLLAAITEIDSSRQKLMAQLLGKLLKEGMPGLDDHAMRKAEGTLRKMNLSDPAVAHALAGANAEKEARESHRIPDGVLTALNKGGLPFTDEANRRADRMIEEMLRMDAGQCAEAARKFLDWGVTSIRALRVLGETYEKSLEEKGTNAQGLLSMLKVLTPRAHHHEELFKNAFVAFAHNAGTLDVNESISLLKVIKRTELEAPDLMKALGDQVAQNCSAVDPEVAANILKFYADRNVNHPTLFSALEERLLKRLDQVSPFSLSTLAWSAAVMARGTDSYKQMLSSKILSSIDSMDVHAATTSVWALAVMEAPDASAAWDKVAARYSTETGRFDETVLVQLHQAGILFEKICPGELGAAIDRALDDRRRKSATQPLNKFEKSVFEALTAAGFEAMPQYFIAGYQIDFLVESNGVRFAVESDGSKFHRVGGNDIGTLLGNSAFRDRVMEKLGIRTVRIVDHDWDFLTGIDDKVRRLQKLLAVTPSHEDLKDSDRLRAA
jgi:hypothetical protein